MNLVISQPSKWENPFFKFSFKTAIVLNMLHMIASTCHITKFPSRKTSISPPSQVVPVMFMSALPNIKSQ